MVAIFKATSDGALAEFSSLINAVPIFLRLTSDATERARAKLAWEIAFGGFVLMAVSLFIGSHILAFFGLTIMAVQIAGDQIKAWNDVAAEFGIEMAWF
jgi:multiple antibiotic resistance protein